jgi:hypothetical protein
VSDNLIASAPLLPRMHAPACEAQFEPRRSRATCGTGGSRFTKTDAATMITLQSRIARLEKRAGPSRCTSVVDRMEAARVRLHAMTPQERCDVLLQECQRALTNDRPADGLALRLWMANRRMVRLRWPCW